MNPNMHNILSSYLKIKKIVGKEEGNFLENEDEDAEEEEEEEMEEKDDDVEFVEGQVKKKKLNLCGGSGNNGKSGGGGGVGGVAAPPWCLVEKCEADLSGCKKYHQRHRVCEIHAKAPVVMVDGLRQRFCQQCSRFHEISEFDQAKRSCRRRLAGHNERRRKSSLESRKECSNRREMD